MVTIYAIRNVLNGKSYIGCTKGKLQKRMREHRCLLRAGKHQCGALQSDWNELGEIGFCLHELEKFGDDSPKAKREAELRWMEAFAHNLYNENRISYQPPPGAPAKAAAARVANGYRQSPESNLKRRLAQLGIPKGHGAAVSAAKKKRRDSLLCNE